MNIKTAYPNSITKEELNTLPIFHHSGHYEIIETAAAVKRAVADLKKYSLLGFDTETRPSFSKGEFHPVALLQLAHRDCCYLFRLNKIILDEDLKSILADESIKKIGVAIHDDVIGLNKLSSFTAAGFIDIAVETRVSRSQTLGLRALTGIYLRQRLSKASKVTNWEKPVLTEAQALYAANDAFAGLLVYEKMMGLA